MKDIAALCKRVVIIANGSIYHDGSLEEIVDKFSSEKIVTLQLANESSISRLENLPNLLEVQPPKIKFLVDRDEVGKTLSQILGDHSIAYGCQSVSHCQHVCSVSSDSVLENHNRPTRFRFCLIRIGIWQS